MSIDPALLAAYADGELNPEQRAEVEAAMAADPALAEQVEAHRALRATLSAHFAPILDMPVPDRLTAALERKADVVDLGEARRAREERKRKEERARARIVWPRWTAGVAIAASLAIGIFAGIQIPVSDPFRTGENNVLLSESMFEKALTTQLASAQPADAPVRILLSFRAQNGSLCRGFSAGTLSGIACRGEDGWEMIRAQVDSGAAGGTGGAYRQAGSAEADIMAAAQDMADGPALDADAERAARASGWR